jgi:hypothetical protein
MAEDDIFTIYRRLDALDAQSLANNSLARIAIGLIALNSTDWRAIIDGVRAMASIDVNSVGWSGSSEERADIVSRALRNVEDSLDDLYAALEARETGGC